jgi:hypothetical protein
VHLIQQGPCHHKSAAAARFRACQTGHILPDDGLFWSLAWNYQEKPAEATAMRSFKLRAGRDVTHCHDLKSCGTLHAPHSSDPDTESINELSFWKSTEIIDECPDNERCTGEVCRTVRIYLRATRGMTKSHLISQGFGTVQR